MELPDAIERVSSAVIQIRSTAGSVLGTGFMVDASGWVLTADHVVAAAEGEPLLAGFAHGNTANMRSNFTLLGVTVIARDQVHDMALLQVSRNPLEHGVPSGIVINNRAITVPIGLAELESARPRDGEAIAVSGYPLQETTLVTTSGIVASAWALGRSETGSGLGGFSVTDHFDMYLLDVAVNPGNSGGPAYRIIDGKVIGVCVAFRVAQLSGVPTNSGLSVVMPARYGLELIGRAKASAEEAAGSGRAE